MNTTEIIAYLGALAWAPQIIQWLYNYFSKPVVTINSDRVAEIGFTLWGPIFNVRLSIDVNKNDTVLDYIGVQLNHESGSEYYFEWTGMTETFSEIVYKDPNQGSSQIIQKDINPIAIKLSPMFLTDRAFRFREISFFKENWVKFNTLNKEVEYVKKLRSENGSNHSIHVEIEKYLDFLRQRFIWKAGKYKIKFSVRARRKIQLSNNDFEFEMTQADVDSLQSNFNNFKIFKTNICNDIENKQTDLTTDNWVWINPLIIKK